MQAGLLQVNLGRPLGRDRAGVDALVNHAQPLAIVRRHGAGLPGRWRQTPVQILEGEQLGVAPEADAGAIAPGRVGEFRIEADITTLQLIHELHLVQHGHRGQQILERQQFAPAGMAHDQIGPQAFGQQALESAAHGFSPQHLGL